MSELIEELKNEHLEIAAALKEAKELGILSKKGLAKLMYIKPILLEHLKKEDERFYPVIYKTTEHNEKLKELLGLFVKDLEIVSKDVPEFFEKYSKGIFDTIFIKEFERLCTAIYKRMRYEEFIFFDEYEEFHQY